eukprot:151156-Rhodomonas_salina.5
MPGTDIATWRYLPMHALRDVRYRHSNMVLFAYEMPRTRCITPGSTQTSAAPCLSFLSTSRERKLSVSLFLFQVQRVPFEDHGPPLMSEMIKFCEEAAKWLEMDQKNTIAVHCKGGKGRTGVMVAAFLMWTGHRCATRKKKERKEKNKKKEDENKKRHGVFVCSTMRLTRQLDVWCICFHKVCQGFNILCNVLGTERGAGGGGRR